MGGEFSTKGGEEERVWVTGGKPDGKSPLGRRSRRWVDIIRMDLVEVGWGDVDWIGLAQVVGALVNSAMSLRVP
jgi:hypothetical protein